MKLWESLEMKLPSMDVYLGEWCPYGLEPILLHACIHSSKRKDVLAG